MTDFSPILEPDLPVSEQLRRAMRRWVTGVSIVTSQYAGVSHGMTVNSFGSISLDPPMVTVTMNHDTRTSHLVEQSGIFAVTILSALQQPLAELFAGRVDAGADRMTGLETFTLATGAPLIHGGIAFVDCRVVHRYPMALSTLYIGQVLEARVIPPGEALAPLVYVNRAFTTLGG
jgi:flavin reductase (DIM6/NTAB) family NADH-FMN oxidoreductase RutF